jgi:hypothetical protein
VTDIAQPIRIYQGDLREVFRNPVALVFAIVGTILIILLISMSLIFLGQDCVKNFNEAWKAQGRERFNPAFLEAAESECEEGDAKCVVRLEQQWIDEESALYALDYQLAVSEACPAETKDEDEYEIEFEPGALVKLGVEIEEKELPEKIITQETRQEEETVQETVTEEEEAAPKVEPPEPDEKPKKKPDKPPVEKKDKKLPTSKMPTKKNTPYDDLPTVDYQKGDPFGDPGGWADLAKDGDPWATAVMKALNNMPVGSYAAKGGKGNFKFQLTLCKDGSIKKVAKKGGSADQETQNGVVLALNRLQLPKPPANVAKKMKKNCAKIKYTFVWSGAGVK